MNIRYLLIASLLSATLFFVESSAKPTPAQFKAYKKQLTQQRNAQRQLKMSVRNGEDTVPAHLAKLKALKKAGKAVQ